MNEQDLFPSRKDRAPRVNDEDAKMRRLATVVLDSNDAITILDFDGRINAWNRGAELMYGYSENEALRMTIWQLAPPDKTAEQKEFNRRIFAGEKVSSFETQRQTKDGGILDVWITVTKLVDDSGKAIGIASTERDITERKKEEANLRRLATVLLDSNDAITISDFDGRITAWNRSAERMYGYSEEEALSMSIWLITPPDKIAEKKAFINRLIAGEAVSSFETQRVTKDGRILDVWLTLTKVMDDAGKPIGIASTERDITERKKEEANLRRLATVLRDSNDAITIQDFEGKILAWNHGAELMYGYSEQEALQKNIWLLTPPNRVKEQKDFTHRLIAGEKITSLETQRVTKDGRILDVWLTLTRVMDDAGKPIGIASTERDITDHKRVEEALKKSEERFRIIAESITDVIYEWDLKDSIQWFGNVDALLGYPAGAFSRTLDGWVSALHPEEKESVLVAIERQLKGAVPYNVEYRIKGKDDVLYWWSARGTVITDERGEKIKWLGAVTDITERKRVEETLRMNEARFRTLVENIPQKIFMKDRMLRWISINEKLAHDFGFRPEDVIGKANADLFPPELAAKYQADDIRIMESGKTEELEEKYIREGRETWVNTIKTPVKNANGEIVGVLGVFWDITERKRLEDKLHQYTLQLEQKSRDLEQIIYVTSHDLRSPLVNVQGFAKELAKSIMELMEAVNTGDISAEAMREMAPILKNDIPESLEYIQSSIARMDMQLSALLKLSRLGRAAITMENLDMNKTIAEVVKSLEYVAQEKEAHITVDELPPCKADSAQTNQIFLNLIENALKYLDSKRPGKIQIRGSRQGSDIVYCIEDNGIGIAPECRKKIFEIDHCAAKRGETKRRGVGGIRTGDRK
jgi:PAS domain S-box-containing protein